jgi:hypothetical protein
LPTGYAVGELFSDSLPIFDTIKVDFVDNAVAVTVSISDTVTISDTGVADSKAATGIDPLGLSDSISTVKFLDTALVRNITDTIGIDEPDFPTSYTIAEAVLDSMAVIERVDVILTSLLSNQILFETEALRDSVLTDYIIGKIPNDVSSLTDIVSVQKTPDVLATAGYWGVRIA